MNRILPALLLLACAEDTNPETPPDCQYVTETACVYADAGFDPTRGIHETGFECPDGFPHRYELEGVVVCSESPLDDGQVREVIDRDADRDKLDALIEEPNRPDLNVLIPMPRMDAGVADAEPDAAPDLVLPDAAPDATAPDAAAPEPRFPDDGEQWICPLDWSPVAAFGTCDPPEESPALSRCRAPWVPVEGGVGCQPPPAEACGPRTPLMGDGTCMPAWVCPAGWTPAPDGPGCLPPPLRDDCPPGQFAVPGNACSDPWPCPETWVRVPDGVGCQPPELRCPGDGWVVGGACVSVTFADCDLELFQREWPAGTVFAAAHGDPGGDGSAEAPFVDLGDAFAAAAEGAQVVLAPGNYGAPEGIVRGLSVTGACPLQTRIEGGLVVDGGASVSLLDLRVRGPLRVLSGGVVARGVALDTIELGPEGQFAGRDLVLDGGEASTVELGVGADFECTRCRISGGEGLLFARPDGDDQRSDRLEVTESLLTGGAEPRGVARGVDAATYVLADVVVRNARVDLGSRPTLRRVVVEGGHLMATGAEIEDLYSTGDLDLEGTVARRVTVREVEPSLGVDDAAHLDWGEGGGVLEVRTGRDIRAPGARLATDSPDAIDLANTVIGTVRLGFAGCGRDRAVRLERFKATGRLNAGGASLVLRDVEAAGVTLAFTSMDVARLTGRPQFPGFVLEPCGPENRLEDIRVEGSSLTLRSSRWAEHGERLRITRLSVDAPTAAAIRVRTNRPIEFTDTALRGRVLMSGFGALPEVSFDGLFGVGEGGFDAAFQESEEVTLDGAAVRGFQQLARANHQVFRRVRFEHAVGALPAVSAFTVELESSRFEGGPLLDITPEAQDPQRWPPDSVRLDRVEIVHPGGVALVASSGAEIDVETARLAGEVVVEDGGMLRATDAWIGGARVLGRFIAARSQLGRAEVTGAGVIDVRGAALAGLTATGGGRARVSDARLVASDDADAPLVRIEDATLEMQRTRLDGAGIRLDPLADATLAHVVVAAARVGLWLDLATARLEHLWIDDPEVGVRLEGPSLVEGDLRVTRPRDRAVAVCPGDCE